MPGLYRDEGIVLKTIKLGEADRIVTLYTRDTGKVRAVAKGIRKTKSRFGARLEPFTQVELMIYKGRSNLDTITQADILTSFDGVRRDYMKLTSASALVDIVEKITPEREPAADIYDLLHEGMAALTAGGGAAVVPGFLVKLLSISGYHPSLTLCAGCGDEHELGAFSPAFGGVVCRSCWHQDRDAIRLTPVHIESMTSLLDDDLGERQLEESMTFEVTQVLRRYAEYHLERPLKSLALFAAS
jgi:DNA repair protein RecO (recombination protein O)